MNFIKNLKTFYLTNKCFNLRQSYYYCRRFGSNSDFYQLSDEEVIKNERLFEDLNIKQFESLAKNENQMKEIESILNDYEYRKYSTLEVPTTLTTRQMRDLLQLSSSKERHKYLSHLYEKEIKSLFDKRVKEIRKTLKQKELSEKWRNSSAERSGIFDANGNIVYGLWHNTLFTRISPQYLRRYSIHRLRTASLFGQNIVFDLRCDPSMKLIECNSKMSQLVKSYVTNRNRFTEPFNLNFCNFHSNGILRQTIEQNSELYSKYPYFLDQFTQKSYLDLFERKSLVYLSPNAKKDLEYNPNQVYIISLCDGFDSKNFVSYVGQKENIDIRRLPIDKYVFWSGHTKDLKSYTVLSILNDVREGIQWREAIERNVPKHFIKSHEIVQKEEAFRLEKLTKQRKIIIDLKQTFE